MMDMRQGTQTCENILWTQRIEKEERVFINGARIREEIERQRAKDCPENVRRYARKNVRKNVRRYVRKNVVRYVRENVKKYVRKNARRDVRENVKRYATKNVRENGRRYVRKNVRKNVDMTDWRGLRRGSTERSGLFFVFFSISGGPCLGNIVFRMAGQAT
eukprot:Skav233102  [mRNA]  locus=scaffold1342:123096:134164:- [translate_table: standard]